LLARSPGGATLTAAGTALLPDARRLLRDADALARAAGSASTSRSLRVGHPPGICPPPLVRAAASLASSLPGVRIVPEAVPARRALDEVRAGRLDVALVGLPAPTAGLRVTPMGTETAVVAMRERRPREQRGPIALTALAFEPLIALPRAADPAFLDGVTVAFRAAGLAPSFVETEEPLVEHALLLVLAGAGIALLPASAVEQRRLPGVCVRAARTAGARPRRRGGVRAGCA
jgi:DNA-binding transcriptional LysR family regulator